MSILKRAWAGILIGCLALMAALPASADDKVDRSVALATEGLELFNRGAFGDAYDKFFLAEQLAHSPVFTIYLARCKGEVGELLAARKHYAAILDEQLPSDAPPTWKQAQQDANKELATLDARIPTLQIRALPREAAVMLDGRPLAADKRSSVSVDPGEHRIEAVVDTRRTERVVVVADGERGKVVELRVPPEPSKSPAPNSSEPSAQQLWWPGAVVGAAGVIGIGLGAVFGGLALAKDDELSSVCGGGVCPRQQEAELDTLANYEVASTIGFVAGGVLTAVGVALLIWRPTQEVAAFVSPTGVRARLSF